MHVARMYSSAQHPLTFLLLLLLLTLEVRLIEPVLERVHALEKGGLHEGEEGEELRQVVLFTIVCGRPK